MSGNSTYNPSNGFTRWLDSRLPIVRLAHDTAVSYPVPKNLNYWWTFGGILTFILVAQIVTGVVLAMHYVPTTALAFASVESIMRDVNYGWMLRYAHANGASMFFVAVYIHMFRGLYYGSYKAPREVLWILGCLIYLLMMATAFFGYVLPWGQMSFWGATVITNLFGAIPFVGQSIATWLWGGYSIGDPTINRFFSLHYLFPFLIFGVVILHIWALHVTGQNNPAGVEVKNKDQDTVPFTPYATVKDAFGLSVFLVMFAYFVFFTPNALGDVENYVVANPLKTPLHIVPEWYLLPFYAILRAVPSKIGGVILMFGAIAVLFVLPWLDTSKVRSARFRPLFKQFFWFHLVVCIALGWCGGQMPDRELYTNASTVGTFTMPAQAEAALTDVRKANPTVNPEDYRVVASRDDKDVGSYVVEQVHVAVTITHLSRLLAFYYFFHFLILFPLLGLIERPKPLPESIAASVLGGKTAAAKA